MTQNEDRSFYQNNELGTVLLTTTYATATVRGMDEPDSFGNYGQATVDHYGTRPDTL